MKILIFEDDKQRLLWFSRELVGNEVYTTKFFAEAVEFLCSHDFDYVFIDNDVEESHYNDAVAYSGTGKKLVDWLAATKLNNNPTIIIHSCNNEEVDYIFNILSNHNYRVIKKSFPFLKTGGISSVLHADTRL